MSDQPERDWNKTLDLNRSQLTRDLVDQLEEAMLRQQTAGEDIKSIAAVALEQEFGPRDVGAMKAIAKLRLKDKKLEANEKLEALNRIGKLVDFDVFDFSWASGS